MSGREYDDWFTAGDEQLIAGLLAIEQNRRLAEQQMRHTYARKRIKWLFITGIAVLCGVVIGPHAWHYIQFQAHSFTHWMSVNGDKIR